MDYLNKYCHLRFKLEVEKFVSVFDLQCFYDFMNAVTKFIPWVHEDDEALVTGAVSYLALLIYSRARGGSKYDESILHFILLYINIDYIFDSKDTDLISLVSSECRQILKNKLLESPSKYGIAAEKSVKFIVENSNCSIETLEKCFIEEYKSVKIQKTSNDRRELFSICINKAKVCVDVIAEIIGVDEPFSSEIGCLVQIVDDLLDYHDDMKNDINTVVTFDIKKDKNLDKLFREAFLMSMKVPYLGVKIPLLFGLIVTGSVSPYVSDHLKHLLLQFYPFSDPEIEYEPNKFIRKFFLKTFAAMNYEK